MQVALVHDWLAALRGELAAVDAQIVAASDRSPSVKTNEAVEMALAGRRAEPLEETALGVFCAALQNPAPGFVVFGGRLRRAAMDCGHCHQR